jgi:hypothetical protein
MRAVAIKKGQNREKAAGFPEMGTQARDLSRPVKDEVAAYDLSISASNASP